jgi:uncharacterized metal-binding protein
MPGARTHDLITVATGIALAPIAYSSNLALGLGAEQALRHSALLVGAHLLSGIMFSPDLDLDGAIDNRWGIFYWIWRPYMWVVPHRSRWLSHGLVLPPLLRLLYFYWVTIGLLISVAWLAGRAGLVLPTFHDRVSDAVFGVVTNYPREKRYIRRLGFEVRFDDPGHDHWQRYHRRRARH